MFPVGQDLVIGPVAHLIPRYHHCQRESNWTIIAFLSAWCPHWGQGIHIGVPCEDRGHLSPKRAKWSQRSLHIVWTGFILTHCLKHSWTFLNIYSICSFCWRAHKWAGRILGGCVCVCVWRGDRWCRGDGVSPQESAGGFITSATMRELFQEWKNCHKTHWKQERNYGEGKDFTLKVQFGKTKQRHLWVSAWLLVKIIHFGGLSEIWNMLINLGGGLGAWSRCICQLKSQLSPRDKKHFLICKHEWFALNEHCCYEKVVNENSVNFLPSFFQGVCSSPLENSTFAPLASAAPEDGPLLTAQHSGPHAADVNVCPAGPLDGLHLVHYWQDGDGGQFLQLGYRWVNDGIP